MLRDTTSGGLCDESDHLALVNAAAGDEDSEVVSKEEDSELERARGRCGRSRRARCCRSARDSEGGGMVPGRRAVSGPDSGSDSNSEDSRQA